MPTSVRLDCYEVDLAAGQLLKRGAKIHLREQSFQVRAALVARPGQVVTREELRQLLWPDHVFVDFDNNLNTAMARLREALSDSGEHPRFIETLPRHGYRFVGTISEPALTPAPSDIKRTRLLVLPFVNSSGDAAQEYFSDAATDGILQCPADCLERDCLDEERKPTVRAVANPCAPSADGRRPERLPGAERGGGG